MFGFNIRKVKGQLKVAFSDCLQPLKDELGNIPLDMHTDPAINGAILGVCEAYAQNQNINKPGDILLIADAVFEELYRRESVEVQERVTEWQEQSNPHFLQIYSESKDKISASLDLNWLTEYAQSNFKPATGRML